MPIATFTNRCEANSVRVFDHEPLKQIARELGDQLPSTLARCPEYETRQITKRSSPVNQALVHVQSQPYFA